VSVIFRPAARERRPAKILVTGPSGSGKTLTSMLVMTAFAKKVAVIQSEPSAETYVPRMPRDVQFDSLLLDRLEPERWTEAMLAAAEQDYEGVILDSLSDEWRATLAAVDATLNSRGSTDNREGWRVNRPRHEAMALTLMRLPIHVIATVRSRQTIDWSSGKPKSMEPVQDNDLVYWFDLAFDMDAEHVAKVIKVRGFEALDGVREHKPTADFLAGYAEWLAAGAEPTTGELAVRRLEEMFPDLGPEVVRQAIRDAGVTTIARLHQPGWFEQARTALTEKKGGRKAKAAA
jgi:AAA domain